MTRTATTLLFLLGLAAPASAQWGAGPIYNVLDAGNLPSIAPGSVGGTTALEKDIAFRPGSPARVFIARGGTTTGDSRTGGAVGVAAALLTPYSTSNYTDTGLMVSGGTPANFSFIQAMTYEPVDDVVYALDGSGATPRVWRFSGSATGGSPSGGGVAATATAAGITHLFQVSSSGAPASGSGRGMGVYKTGSTVYLALGMGTYATLFKSTDGGSTFTQQWKSAAIGSGTNPVRDVAVDENGDVWATLSSSSVARSIRYYPSASADGVVGTNFLLPSGSFDNTGVAANVNSLGFYREGTDTYLVTTLRSNSGTLFFLGRFRRTGTAPSYTFTAVDGFGNGFVSGANTGNVYADGVLETTRYLATGATIPSAATTGHAYFSLPYKNDGTQELSHRAIYLGAAAKQASQASPTSGVITAWMPSNLTFAGTYDGSSNTFTPGTNDNPILGFSAIGDAADAPLASVTLNRTGDATDAETGLVKVWLDADASNTVTGGDTELGSGSFSGGTGVLTINLTGAVVTRTLKHFLITVDVAALPPANRKGSDAQTAAKVQAGAFGLSIAQAGITTTGATTAVQSANFPIATAGGASLPVELASFTGTANGRVASLAWTTTSETNNAGFYVERQAGESWQELGFVAGHGTTTEAQAYAFTTPNLAVGRHEFRLRQVDSDGKLTYSPSVTVEIATDGRFQLSAAMPNPATSQAQWALSVSEPQQVRADVYDMLGRRVATLFNGQLAASTNETLVFDATNLSSGMYVVRVVGETFQATSRVQIVR